MAVIHHPVAQVAAASMIAASLPTNVGMIAAGVATVYYCILILDYIRNWKPSGAPSTASAVLAKLWAIWSQDKPYLAALMIFAMAGLSAFNVPIPPWVMMVAAGLGVGSMHSFVRNLSGDKT